MADSKACLGSISKEEDSLFAMEECLVRYLKECKKKEFGIRNEMIMVSKSVLLSHNLFFC